MYQKIQVSTATCDKSERRVKYLLLAIIAFFSLQLATPPVSYGLATIDSPLEATQAAFRQVPCMQENRYRYHKDTIRALSYTRMRALRAFCALPDVTADVAIQALEQLVFYPLTFDQVQLLEFFSDLPGATIADGWLLLERSAHLDFTTMQAVSAIDNITGLTPEKTLELIERIQTIDESGHWALKAFFSLNDIDSFSGLLGVRLIAKMTKEQTRAAEQSCLISAMTPLQALAIFQYIQILSSSDAANSQALFGGDRTTPDSALSWLQHYFAKPGADREALYFSLSDQQKGELLSSFSNASDFLIQKINNLHGVTNEYGGEISTGTLVASSRDTLESLFNQLHPKAQARFQEPFSKALDTSRRHDAVQALKNATSLARKLTARELSSANIYILLSLGSELYDSSFRDILVPVLLKRINKSFHANLLEFLVETDPLNNHVSDFIIGCAQKGKLTAFFPKNEKEQRKILDLIAGSAFQDEQSLILFSATFTTLLGKLQPEARSYLITRMVETIRQPDSTFALQLRVILQYYFNKHPDLLSKPDREKIAALIQRYGQVDLAPYITTDFRRWKQDGRLRSLSIFQHDDDGKISYISNSRNLIKNGYRPRLSEIFHLLPTKSPARKEAGRLVTAERRQPGSSIRAIYRLSVQHPIVIEWYKEVNNLELSHGVTVYQSKFRQRQLLKQFMQSKIEMFAQRGHSYWREEQLLMPMRDLLETGQITTDNINDINRFMSIGSCGGIRVYSELNRLFNNSVDIFATVGTGKAIVNDPYNRQLFEIVAFARDSASWEDITRNSESILSGGRDSDYLQPGSLPAILHKMMDTRNLN
jgi:hypothetical protein